MAINTNISQTLFLARPQEEACFGELANVSDCRNVTTKFVAGNSPCAFQSYEELTDILKISADNEVSFERVLKDCGPSNADQEVVCSTCASSFNAAVHLLNTSLQDDSFVCASALFVSLASTNTDNPQWTNSLYACAQQQQLSIHLPPAPATGTSKFSFVPSVSS